MEHARAVIIGGGVGGSSVAYHLTELGWRDVVLVDRSALTSGSTFHSAGLVGGYAVERSIAYAYLPPDVGVGTRGEVESFDDWVGFEVAREPLYDPTSERIRP